MDVFIHSIMTGRPLYMSNLLIYLLFSCDWIFFNINLTLSVLSYIYAHGFQNSYSILAVLHNEVIGSYPDFNSILT